GAPECLGDGLRIGVGYRPIECRDRGIEALPELARAPTPGARAELIGRLGILRAWDRAPQEPGGMGMFPGHLLTLGCLGQRSQPPGEARVRRRELVSAHRLRPAAASLAYGTHHLIAVRVVLRAHVVARGCRGNQRSPS